MSEHIDLAKAAMQVLGPALPALTGTVAQAVGDLAKATWNTIRPWLIEDPSLAAAEKLVKVKPESKHIQAELEDALAEHLKANPAHAEALGTELAKGQVVQRVEAEGGSKVWKVVVSAEGSGDADQRVVARGQSTISGVQLIKK
ncbi:MAG TPA: hypothetical protein VFB81_17580 [Myxococcales bacterium]|nr:hypothetical protein [Myxococcales bacterium]